jgi:arylsulfatase A-like enzyme
MPTLLELSGLQPPAGMQGRSLVPLLNRKAAGPVPGWTERPTITEKLLSKDEHHDSESFAIVAGGWKLVHNAVRTPGMPEFELYDFATDPLDRHDLSSRQPDVVRKLSAELARWRRKAEAERVKPDAEAARALSSDELERLRALGYVQ